MAVHASGTPLTMTQIVAEFGGPYNLSSHIRGGAYVPNGPAQNNGIPTTTLNMMYSGFYGAVATFIYTYNVPGNTYNFNLHNILVSGGWDSLIPVIVVVNNYYQIGSTSTGAYAFDTGVIPASSSVTINNYGYIEGCGGAGGLGSSYSVGGPGGPAFFLRCNVTINTSTGYIGGGGGGGGSGNGINGFSGGGGGSGFNGGASGGGGGGLYYSTAIAGTVSAGGQGSYYASMPWGAGGAGGTFGVQGGLGRGNNIAVSDGGGGGGIVTSTGPEGAGGGGGLGASGGAGGTVISGWISDGSGYSYDSPGNGTAGGAAGAAIVKNGYILSLGVGSAARIFGAIY